MLLLLPSSSFPPPSSPSPPSPHLTLPPTASEPKSQNPSHPHPARASGSLRTVLGALDSLCKSARGPPAASGRFSGEPQDGSRDLRQPPGQLSVRAVIWLRSRACHLRSLEIDFLSWGAGQKRAILFKSFIDETLICCPRSC